jgi:hypothetical protein
VITNVAAAACSFIACYDDNFLDLKEYLISAVSIFITVMAFCFPEVIFRPFFSFEEKGS